MYLIITSFITVMFYPHVFILAQFFELTIFGLGEEFVELIEWDVLAVSLTRNDITEVIIGRHKHILRVSNTNHSFCCRQSVNTLTKINDTHMHCVYQSESITV